MKPLAPAIAYLWAGLAFGATLIATPVKFLAPSLSLSTALEIGRVTFHWVGIAEIVLCAAFIVSLIAFGGIKWRFAVVPILVFAIQRLGLMPALDTRAVQIIAGGHVSDSHLHEIYIILEFAKVFALLIAGSVGLFAKERIIAEPEVHVSPSLAPVIPDHDD